MQKTVSSNNPAFDKKEIINLAPNKLSALVDNIVRNACPEQAIHDLERLSEIVPEQAQIWQNLVQLYANQHQQQKANQAQSQFKLIDDFNQKLNQASLQLQQGDLPAADMSCRKLLALVPNEIRTLRLLAQISATANRPDVCLSILQHCVNARPLDCQLNIEYINALLGAGQAQNALKYAQQNLVEHPENTQLLAAQAQAQVKTGAYCQAEKSYRKLLMMQPENSLCHLRLGNVLKIIGKTQQAIECYLQALSMQADLGEAYWNLANTKIYAFSDNEITSMQQLLSKPNLDQHNLTLLNFALGKALEDKQQYTESFAYYRVANDLMPKAPAKNQQEQIAALKQTFNKDYFSQGQTSALKDNEAIFIIGLPRSGSTLVEQILSSHSLIDGTMELTAMPQLVHKLNITADGRLGAYPASVKQLTASQINNLSKEYLHAVAPFRKEGQYFIDKLPANFQHIGLIKTLFPNAKIIDVRRHPMACGWSIYSQYFASGVPYAYDQTTIAQHYNNYIEMMGHWHNVLPGEIFTLNYEQLIEDFAPTVQSLLAFCQVPMQQSCLQYFSHSRPVATPSAEQVRQAPYSSSLHRWKHFEAFLQPLSDSLTQKT